ncbi:MAG: VOC family protein [Roseomonas sp.]|nr:VOC family protein [Roseomonas sp.]
MPEPNFTVLYVADVSVSTDFYTKLLGRPPVQVSPGFALFALQSGMMLGLWLRSAVQPPAGAPGGCELSFQLAAAAEVIRLHADWVARGLDIISAPAQMDFGFSFLAQDPDGHRLRVFAAP